MLWDECMSLWVGSHLAEPHITLWRGVWSGDVLKPACSIPLPALVVVLGSEQGHRDPAGHGL